ncbi:hypothetical protein OS493_018158 [Desmophyllum pertusum]|uniref:Uncharacterized protein n=1 Tax=Desmophyllum pertusum TaxID=174260 RepID=A0A9W9YND9_9CNID|nr:hypothetical protein OS493_018158 [Desmophyllum pertusum]
MPRVLTCVVVGRCCLSLMAAARSVREGKISRPEEQTEKRRVSSKQHLLKLYGKITESNQKLRAVDSFDKGMDLADIARKLCVQRPTVEVYLIDGLVAGKEVDHNRLGNQLDVTEDHFLLLQVELSLKSGLREVKQSCPTSHTTKFALCWRA